MENYWRSVILFGLNVASYKCALGKSLLELKNRGNDLVTLEELALPFARHIVDHLRKADKQATSRSSQFLNECRKFNRGEIDESRLSAITAKLGFVNVIDAFHIVNGKEIPTRFFLDERKSGRGIRLTHNLYVLRDPQALSLEQEAEARWRLVETAWELNLSRNLVTVSYDGDSQDLYADRSMRRVTITSCRGALNGYQKGKCFFCFGPIELRRGSRDIAEVDHFFPHVLRARGHSARQD